MSAARNARLEALASAGSGDYVLFVCGGAFAGLEKIIERRVGLGRMWHLNC